MFNNTLISFTADQDSFIAGGMEFFIYDEHMCFDRVVRFYELSSKIVSGSSVTDILTFIKGVYQKLRSEGTANAVNGDAQRMVFNFLQTVAKRPIDNIMQENFDDFYDICSLFIYTKDEDMKTLDQVHLDKKIEVWKKHCDYKSFFLLGTSRLPQLVEILTDESAKPRPNQV